MDTVNLIFPWFSVASLIISGASPVAVGVYSHRARRKDVEDERVRRQVEREAEDERRREEEVHRGAVAAEALKIAQDLVAQNRELNESTSTKVAEIADTVHQVIPNGNLTASMENELAANQTALRAMQDAIEIKTTAKLGVQPQEYERIATLKLRIEALSAQIYNRKYGT